MCWLPIEIKINNMSIVRPSEWQVEPWWARAVRSCAVQGCAELRGVALRALRSSARAHRSAALAAGCGGLKVKLDQLLETRGEAAFRK